MAINRKYGINPRLISLITGKDLSEIPDSPTASKLPGHYGRIVAKKMDNFPREFPKNVHSLICTSRAACGLFYLEPAGKFLPEGWAA